MRLIASANVCAIESWTNFGCFVPFSNGIVFGEEHALDLGLFEHVDCLAGEYAVRSDGVDPRLRRAL